MADIQLGGSVGTTGTAILGRANIVMPSDADYTLLVTEYTNQYLYVTSGVSLALSGGLSGGTMTIFPEPGAIIDPSYYTIHNTMGITIQGIAYGTGCVANGENSLTVGSNCLSSGDNSLAIGSGGSSNLDDMIAVGGGTGIRTQTTQTVGIQSNPFVTPTNQEFVTTTNTSYMWTVRVTAQDFSGAGNLAAWEYKVTGKNTGGNLVLQDTGTLVYSSLGGNTWTITFSVQSSNIFRFTLNGTNNGQQVVSQATIEWTHT